VPKREGRTTFSKRGLDNTGLRQRINAMNIFKTKKNPQKNSDKLSLREADEIIKDFLVESKNIAKRTKELRKAFMLDDHIPKSYLQDAEWEFVQKGLPFYACKVFALSKCIDESLSRRG
jgi:hypothetical protein